MNRVTLVHAPCGSAIHLTVDDAGVVVVWCAWCNQVIGKLVDVEPRATKESTL